MGGAEPSEALNRSSTKPLSIEALFFFCFRAGDTFPADADPVIGDASDVFTDVVTAADEPKVGSAGAGPNVESPEAAADPSDRATGPKVGAGTSVLVVAGVADCSESKGTDDTVEKSVVTDRSSQTKSWISWSCSKCRSLDQILQHRQSALLLHKRGEKGGKVSLCIFADKSVLF